jgi:hypothetical protein
MKTRFDLALDVSTHRKPDLTRSRRLDGVGVVKRGFERLDLWTGFR